MPPCTATTTATTATTTTTTTTTSQCKRACTEHTPHAHASRIATTCTACPLQLLRLSNGSEHKLHGGMGVIRLRNVAGGGADNMVDACGLRSGDVFIDATAGQLSDAIVAAQVVGAEGRVLAIEASPL